MMKLELVEIRRPVDFQKNLRETLERTVTKVIKRVHEEAVDLSPVDRGLLRNNLVYNLNGGQNQGANQFTTTSPESPWGHKKGARPVGASADMASTGDLMRFPPNTEPDKMTVGYVASNVKRDGHFPYNICQELEYGWHDRAKNWHAPQPFFRPAVYQFGVDPVVRPEFLRALRNMPVGPLLGRKVTR